MTLVLLLISTLQLCGGKSTCRCRFASLSSLEDAVLSHQDVQLRLFFKFFLFITRHFRRKSFASFDTDLGEHFESGAGVSRRGHHDFRIFNSSPFILIIHVWAHACARHSQILWLLKGFNSDIIINTANKCKHQPSAPSSSYSTSFCSCRASLRSSVGRM